MHHENPVSALRVDDQDFLIRSTIDRCPKIMMIRELFMNGQGPVQMQRAIISILAGQVFPRPSWALRWRHRAFDACVQLQKHVSLVPRRAPCRLVEQDPIPVPGMGVLAQP